MGKIVEFAPNDTAVVNSNLTYYKGFDRTKVLCEVKAGTPVTIQSSKELKYTPKYGRAYRYHHEGCQRLHTAYQFHLSPVTHPCKCDLHTVIMVHGCQCGGS